MFLNRLSPIKNLHAIYISKLNQGIRIFRRFRKFVCCSTAFYKAYFHIAECKLCGKVCTALSLANRWENSGKHLELLNEMASVMSTICLRTGRHT